MKIEDKLYLLGTKADTTSHLAILDAAVCLSCALKDCTYVCPADVYHWNEEQGTLVVGWENCVETGACISACPYANITFRYPRGGYGVEFKQG